jgi:succinyl-diaminopimelate desuccinylase
MSQQQASRLTEILAELIAFRSETDNLEECAACLKHIADFLQPHGMHLIKKKQDGFSSLVATTHPTQSPRVLLQAHVDVVPAKAASFRLEEKDGKLWGRGTYDMKFAAACYLLLIEELGAQLKDYDFGLMLTTDEEVGGENGVAFLLEQGFGADICVLPDGGDNWQIESACNGGWFVEVSATGKNAHGSRPWEGANAIDALMTAIQEIRNVFGEHDASKCSLTVSQIKGGEAINQVPDHAIATLDMRFRNQDHYQAKRKQVEAIVQKLGLNLEVIAETEPFTVDLKEKPVARFIEIAEQVVGKPIGDCHSYGSSDARFLRKCGIATILLRPDGGGAHSDEEWIDAEGLHQFYDVLKAYVSETAKIT